MCKRNNLFELVQVPAGNHCVTAMPEEIKKRVKYDVWTYDMWKDKETTVKRTDCKVWI